MRAWLLIPAVLTAPVARGDPLNLTAPAAPTTSAPSASGPAAPATTGRGAADYAPPPLAAPTVRYDGWGMRATIAGRSMDLDAPLSGWASDPAAGPKDIQAGYAWRSGGADAVLGYGQFDLGAKGDPGGDTSRFDALRRHGGADGVLGFSFVLHGR